jgi:hypothetical protein
MTTAITNIRVLPVKAGNDVFDFWVVANRGDDRVILARTNWQNGSLCHPWTETEAKCWADLFADALRLKRENDKLKQELADQGWQPIETAPKDVAILGLLKTDDGYDYEVMKWTVNVWQATNDCEPFCCRSWYCEPTHWMPLPTPPLCATQGNSLPAEVRA